MPPSWLQSLVLGVVQGLTEFIPVSSSGHLVLVPYLAGWERPGLAFDVALHMGTALAIVVFFRRELIAMARGLLRGGDTPDGRLYRRLALMIVAGSIPVGVIGLTFKDAFAATFESPAVAAAFLFVTAALLWSGERWRARRIARRIANEEDQDRSTPRGGGDGLSTGADANDPAGLGLDRIGPRQALVIGTAQIFALLPGVSRSGTTIVAGLFAGLTREAATRFSFLLGLPAMAGAEILSLPDLASDMGIYTVSDVLLGVVASFLSGYAAIRFLVALVARERLTGFAIYCVVAGASGLIGFALIG